MMLPMDKKMRKSRLSKHRQGLLIEHFVAGTTARTAANICDVNLASTTYFYRRLRLIIIMETERERQAVMDGSIEVDESYFGGTRKGKRGRGAAGKVAVFGILRRGGKVYRQIIADASARTLSPIMTRKIKPDSIVYTDSWRGYQVLDVSGFRHWRINHAKRFAESHNHINGIENFWNQAKRHLRRFNGIPRAHFGLFLRECEWRFNNNHPTAQIILLKQWVKKHLQ